MLQKAPGTCRNKASCNCSTYLRAGDKGRLVGFGCMGWLVGKTGFLFRQLVTECWPGNTLRQTLTDWLAILFPYYFHTISHPPVWMPSNNLDHNCSNVKNRAASQTSWRPRVIPNSVLQGLQFFVPQNSMSLFARNSGSSRSSCPTWTRCSRIFPWTTSTKSMTWAITWDPQRLCIRHHKNIITQLNIYIYYIHYIIWYITYIYILYNSRSILLESATWPVLDSLHVTHFPHQHGNSKSSGNLQGKSPLAVLGLLGTPSSPAVLRASRFNEPKQQRIGSRENKKAVDLVGGFNMF